MANFAFLPLLTATWQTLYMVVIASIISLFCGLAIGILLFLTAPNRALEQRKIYQLLSIIINFTRSIPFIILMISILPLTRLLIGTTIGTNAAIVPLSIAAIPFFARICENALENLPASLLETANALGASTWQLIWKFLLPESLPSLIRGGTLTIIALIGYSAMAGAVGGGGLGELAIDYGYQQFNTAVMIETVIILVVIVQAIQYLGDYFANRRRIKPLLFASLVFVLLSSIVHAIPEKQHQQNSLRVGIISGPSEKVLQVAQKLALKRYQLHLKIITFNDYILPNTALNNGDIDANIFQHIPFLETQIKARGYQLTPIAKTFVYPMGFYSKKISQLSELKENAVVAIPNDPSNEARSLLILQKYGLIKLKSNSESLANIRDIISNPLHLKLTTLDAAQLPRVFQDAALVALTNDFVGQAGLSIKQAILHEGADSPYANVIVVRSEDKNNPLFKELITIMHSKEVQQETEKLFPNGEAIAAW